MKNQCHLVVSEDSLPERVSHQGLCGKVVQNAAYALIFDEIAMESSMKVYVLKMANVCRKCVERYADTPGTGMTKLYGFFDGRAVRKEQDENHSE